MQKYKYRESGIQWLGKIPEHWKTTKIKNEFVVIPSNVDKRIEEDETPVKLCNYVDVYYNDFITNKIEFMEATATDHEINKFILNEGDVLITKDSEDPFDIAVAAVVKETQEKLLCGYHLSMIRSINNKISGEFLFWLLKDYAIASQLHREAVGVTRWAIASKHIKNSIISCPPIKEQKAIAEYLKKTCQKIDKVIEIKERQFEKIQEYFLSVRNKLITKGIKNNKFKNVEEDTLKTIPEHWKVKKLRYLVELKNGKLITNDELVDDGKYPVYGGNGIMGFTDKYNYEGELLILGRVGAKCGNVHYTNEKIWVSDNAIAVRSKINYDFMLQLLTNLDLHKLASETAQPLLVGNNVKKLYVAVPPEKERSDIAKQISDLELNISKLKEKSLNQIKLLKEYRQSIIHECVTGKKQVADIAVEKEIKRAMA